MNQLGLEVTNYNGGLAIHPKRESKGRFVLKDGGQWELHFRGHGFQGGLLRYRLEAEPTGPSSCRVTLTDSEDETQRAIFDLPRTQALGLQLAVVTYAAKPTDVLTPQKPLGPGWWSAVPPGTLSPVAYNSRSGALTVDAEGVFWQGSAGGWCKIPWNDLQAINVQTFRQQHGQKRSAFGIGPVGLAVVAATAVSNSRAGKVTVTQRITLTDGKGVPFAFSTGLPRSTVDVVMNPIVVAMKASNTPEPLPAPALVAAISVADELAKLAQLRDSGVLTEEEFSAQKAKLLG
jgi:hypothetical protein